MMMMMMISVCNRRILRGMTECNRRVSIHEDDEQLTMDKTVEGEPISSTSTRPDEPFEARRSSVHLYPLLIHLYPLPTYLLFNI